MSKTAPPPYSPSAPVGWVQPDQTGGYPQPPIPLQPQPVMMQPGVTSTHTSVTVNAGGVGCPVCHSPNSFSFSGWTLCGWLWGICCFPCGILCCLCCYKRKTCSKCGYSP